MGPIREGRRRVWGKKRGVHYELVGIMNSFKVGGRLAGGLKGVPELDEIKKCSKTCQQESYPILYGHEIYQTKIQLDRTWFTLPPKPLLFTKIYKGFSKFIKEKYFHE